MKHNTNTAVATLSVQISIFLFLHSITNIVEGGERGGSVQNDVVASVFAGCSEERRCLPC